MLSIFSRNAARVVWLGQLLMMLAFMAIGGLGLYISLNVIITNSSPTLGEWAWSAGFVVFFLASIVAIYVTYREGFSRRLGSVSESVSATERLVASMTFLLQLQTK